MHPTLHLLVHEASRPARQPDHRHEPPRRRRGAARELLGRLAQPGAALRARRAIA